LTFSRGDVVKVPFPYTDSAARQSRPALVVSGPELEADHGLLWVLMITTAANRGWSGDVGIPRLPATGLPVASVVRTAKIATLDCAHATRIGRVASATLTQVLRHIGMVAGIAPA
jgi:mRNA interferase MazF